MFVGMGGSVLGEVARAVESLLPCVDVVMVKRRWDGNSVARLLAVFALNRVVDGGVICDVAVKSVGGEFGKVAEASGSGSQVFYAVLGVVVQSAKGR